MTGRQRMGACLWEVLLVEAADEAAAVVFGYVIEGAPFAGQEAAAERRPCDDAYAERPGHGYDLDLASHAGWLAVFSESESAAMDHCGGVFQKACTHVVQQRELNIQF